MRHRIRGRKLNRTASHKKALLRNIANQLFEYKEIKTTIAKAKEARSTVERLITYAKKGDTHHRRLAFAFLRQKATINTLFDEIAPTYTDRPGGYTRIIKLGRRPGDGAPVCILQLVGFEKLAETSKAEKSKKSKEKVVKDKETEKEEIKEVSETKVDKKVEKEEEKLEEQVEGKEEKIEDDIQKVEEKVEEKSEIEEEPPPPEPQEDNKEEKSEEKDK